MASGYRLKKPVVIIGTPRSGTSMLQRLLRGQPGFMSLAMESNAVWRPYTHPPLNDWKREGWPGESLSAVEISRIHRALLQRAIPSWVWRRVDARKVGERRHQKPLIAALSSPAYRIAALASWLAGINRRARLVEKSVHSALWLDLVDTVFPDAVYVHIVRNPRDNLRSMIHAWLDPDRFFTYDLPKPIRSEGYPFDKWNLPLPPGWEQQVDRPLEHLVAFQWAAMQEGLVDFTKRRADQVLRLKLEELSGNPHNSLTRLAQHVGLEWNEHLEQYTHGLPRVNAGPMIAASRPDSGPLAQDHLLKALQPYSRLVRELGY